MKGKISILGYQTSQTGNRKGRQTHLHSSSSRWNSAVGFLLIRLMQPVLSMQSMLCQLMPSALYSSCMDTQHIQFSVTVTPSVLGPENSPYWMNTIRAIVCLTSSQKYVTLRKLLSMKMETRQTLVLGEEPYSACGIKYLQSVKI